MARMRTVKPEFFRSATIGKLKRDTRLLFIGMWTEADDAGRGLAEPRHLAGSLFPFDRDVTERKVRTSLRELETVVCSNGERGLIVLYEANGSLYYAIRNWWHQKVNRPGPSRYPEPPPETLFSVNGGPPSAPLDSGNGTRQGSGVRGQGSGSKARDCSLGSSVATTARPPDDVESDSITPEERHRLAHVVQSRPDPDNCYLCREAV